MNGVYLKLCKVLSNNVLYINQTTFIEKIYFFVDYAQNSNKSIMAKHRPTISQASLTLMHYLLNMEMSVKRYGLKHKQ